MNNRITISASELKPALAGFSKVIEKRTTLPVLGCVLFQTNPEGQIQVTATNLDDYVTRTIPGESGSQFSAAVPLEPLKKLVKTCPDTTQLTIESAKDEVRIVYPVGDTNFVERIATSPTIEFPAIPRAEWQDITTVGNEFKKAIVEALDTTSTDDSRHILKNAFVDVSDPKAHYIVGTDGKQLFAANSFRLTMKESLIFPHRRFILWKGFLEDGGWNITMGPEPKKNGKDPVNAGWVKVCSENWTLVTRQIDGTYPNWKQVLPVRDDGTVIRFSQEATNFIEIAAPRLPGAKESDAALGLIATDGGSFLLEAAGKGTSTTTVPVTGAAASGQPMTRRINRKYLIRALNLGLTELCMFQDDYVVVFKNEGRRYAVACLRDQDGPPLAQNPSAANAPAQKEAEAPEEEATLMKTASARTAAEPEEPEMKTVNRMENVTPGTTSNGNNLAPASAFDQVRTQLEAIKDNLKSVVTDLNHALKLLAQAQRERRATEKEIEEVRSTLHALQKIRI